ncbi:hypothetical protein EDB19DRAFT_1915115 [Suillus lakei]|nr:hypothetical protein EDB19DRAFT_1915115 [Suillus lakei]
MDFMKFDHSLQHFASWHHSPVEMMLERWLERWGEMNYPNTWRELDGIPCIVGGLAALLGKIEVPGGFFPWKRLPTELAQRGYVLQHYPEDVLMPGEKCTTLAKSKGIHDLTLCEHQIFANALKSNLLTIKLAKMPVQSLWPPIGLSSSGKHPHLIPTTAVIGVDTSSDTSPEPSPAPVSDVPRPHPGPASMHPHPGPASVHPCPGPASLALGKPNIDELILDISCLGQASQYSDGATHEEDKVEVDELFGTQGSKVVCAV